MAFFYIADLHLGHENVTQFDKRPFSGVEEMAESCRVKHLSMGARRSFAVYR